jgi:hypothetical protein
MLGDSSSGRLRDLHDLELKIEIGISGSSSAIWFYPVANDISITVLTEHAQSIFFLT